MKRLGAAKGSGSGYRNLRRFPRDSSIHAQSAKGMKQPQLKNLSFPQLKKKGVFLKYWGDADKDGKPNIKDCKPLDPTRQADYKSFPVKNGVEIICHWEKTRNGFRHLAMLMVDGNEVSRAKVSYLNRTWESYEYETVMKRLLESTDALSETEKKKFFAIVEGKSEEEANRMFGNIAMVAKIGEVLTDSKKESNDWKKRMLKAGLPALDVPEDWDTLSEDEKEKRLNKVIAQLQHR